MNEVLLMASATLAPLAASALFYFVIPGPPGFFFNVCLPVVIAFLCGMFAGHLGTNIDLSKRGQ